MISKLRCIRGKKRWIDIPIAAFFVACLASSTLAQDVLLEEIVVTARKVQENLQDTPIAISAFTQETLNRRMIFNTEDLSRVTPNLQFKSYAPLSGSNSAAQVFIRGIGQTDASGGIDPGVGMYIDDVYMGRAVGGIMDFRDISNVQVLRGPQGTLFGRNTIGGAILLTTTAPGDKFGGEIKVGTGSDGLLEFFGAADLPFSDNIAARVSLGGRKRDGYVTRIYDGLDLGNEDSYTVKGALHLDPTESLNIVLRGDYTKEDENGSPFVFAAINETATFPAVVSVGYGCPGATFPPPHVPSGVINQNCANNATWNLGNYTNGGNTKAESNLENYGASMTLTLAINDMLSFKSITADRSMKWGGARDADNTFLTILSTEYTSKADQFSQEVQMLVTENSFKGVAGVFYFDEDVHDNLLVPYALPPAVLPPGDQVGLDYQDSKMNNKSLAYFTQWTFDVTDALSLTGGIRYTDEKKTMDIIAWGAPFIADRPVPDPLPIIGPIPTTAPPLNVEPFGHKRSFTATTGSLNLEYRFTERIMSYFSWSQGFKSGGFNQRYNAPTADLQPLSFASEEAETYELGFKADITNSFRLNGAFFTTDYDNMQLVYRVGIVPLLFNAGKATIRGAELEFTYVPNAKFILEGSLGYLDDEINSVDEIPLATATLGPSNDLPFTPDLTANIGGAYSFNMGRFLLTPRLDISYTSEQFFDAANTKEVAQMDPVTITNFSLKLNDLSRRWSVVAGIDNLTDEVYPIAGNSSLDTSAGYAEVIYSRERTYYLSAKYKF